MRETMLDNLIHKFGFEDDRVIEFAHAIDKTPKNWLGDKIIETIYREYLNMSMSE